MRNTQNLKNRSRSKRNRSRISPIPTGSFDDKKTYGKDRRDYIQIKRTHKPEGYIKSSPQKIGPSAPGGPHITSEEDSDSKLIQPTKETEKLEEAEKVEEAEKAEEAKKIEEAEKAEEAGATLESTDVKSRKSHKRGRAVTEISRVGRNPKEKRLQLM